MKGSQVVDVSTPAPPEVSRFHRGIRAVATLVDTTDRCCCICLEEMIRGTVVVDLLCGHYMCGECEKRWPGYTCPMCRRKVPIVELKEAWNFRA